MLRALLLWLALAIAGAAALAQASMSADVAYVRAVSYFQGELNRMEVDRRIDRAKANAEARAVRAQLAAALKELETLRAEAGRSKAAAAALDAFAAADPAKGLDALEAEAQAKAQSALADWKRIGALAFASDTSRAVRAYEEALKLAPSDAETLSRLGWLYTRIGAIAAARDLAARLIASPDPALRARGLLDSARGALAQDNPLRAEGFYAQALEPARAARSPALEAEAIAGLAATADLQGNWAKADGLYKETLAAFRAAKDEAGEADALIGTAAVARQRGIWPPAEAALTQAAAILERLNDRAGLAAVQLGLGQTAMVRGSPIAAHAQFRTALRAFEALGDRAGQADAAKGIGDAAFALKSVPEACLNWRRAHGLYAQTGAFSGAQAKGVDDALAKSCR
jgi:hypothetical protein